VGVTGPDGAYLARFLLDKGYDVYGTSRNIGLARTDGLRTLGIRDKVSLLSVSPVDFRSVSDAIERVAPHEIYNLSGQSSVALSFSQPAETLSSVTQATINFLEALRLKKSNIRFYNAGSSEMFGDTNGHAANESTTYRPKSPYGVAKAAAVSLVANYRDAYGLFACSGLLFNHESPLRPDHFVSRKITAAAARIANGSGERLKLGDISIHRDWGWAADYVEAMWMMLQHDRAEEFVIASGVAHRLDEFVSAAFAEVGLAWQEHVEYDDSLRRPTDIRYSRGDPSKAAQQLGWRPTVGFAEVISRMVHAEQEKCSRLPSKTEPLK